MRKITSDTLIYVGGELLVKLFPFVLLPILSRALGPEGYSDISLFNTYVSILFIFIGINTSSAIIQFYFVPNGLKDSDYFNASLIIVLLLTILFLIISSIFFSGAIFQLAVLTTSLQCIYTNLLSQQQARKEAKKYLVIQVSNAIISFVLTLLLLAYLPITYKLRVYAVAASYLASILISIYLSKQYFHISTKANITVAVKRLFSFGFPLIIHNLSFFARSGLDRILIAKFFSKSLLGNYSAAFQLTVFITVVLMAINKAMTPHIYENLKNNKYDLSFFNNIFIKYFLLCLVITSLSYFLPHQLYEIITGKGYVYVKDISFLMVPAFLSQGFYMIMATTCMYFNENKKISYCTFAGGVIHALLLYFVCVKLNIFYIPMVLLASNIAISVLIYLAIFRKLNFQNAE